MRRDVQEQEEEPEYDEGDLGDGPSAKRRRGPEEAKAEEQGAEDADMGEGEEGEGEGEEGEPVFTPGGARGRGGEGRGGAPGAAAGVNRRVETYRYLNEELIAAAVRDLRDGLASRLPLLRVRGLQLMKKGYLRAAEVTGPGK